MEELAIIQEKSDYMKWQREYFDAMTPEEISSEASHFEATQPFTGNAERFNDWIPLLPLL